MKRRVRGKWVGGKERSIGGKRVKGEGRESHRTAGRRKGKR